MTYPMTYAHKCHAPARRHGERPACVQALYPPTADALVQAAKRDMARMTGPLHAVCVVGIRQQLAAAVRRADSISGPEYAEAWAFARAQGAALVALYRKAVVA